MKHQEYIDKFVRDCDEFDGYCNIFWLPGDKFNGVLPEPRTDIIGAYLDLKDGLSFLLSSEDDRDQTMASFGELPYHVQKELVLYFHNYKSSFNN